MSNPFKKPIDLPNSYDVNLNDQSEKEEEEEKTLG